MSSSADGEEAADVDEAIRRNLRETDYAEVLRARGVPIVTVDESGQVHTVESAEG